MARTVKEWIGKNDNVQPPTSVLIRLFEAAKGLCQQCGIKVGPKAWNADHIVRLKDGGGNRETNLQVLCLLCHREKTGQENALGAIANRQKARYLGIKKKTRNPVPGSKASKWARRYNKATGRFETVRREP